MIFSLYDFLFRLKMYSWNWIVDLLFIFLWQENGEYSLVKKVFSPAEKLYGHT